MFSIIHAKTEPPVSEQITTNTRHLRANLFTVRIGKWPMQKVIPEKNMAYVELKNMTVARIKSIDC
jgi:hypothetical protein